MADVDVQPPGHGAVTSSHVQLLQQQGAQTSTSSVLAIASLSTPSQSHPPDDRDDRACAPKRSCVSSWVDWCKVQWSKPWVRKLTYATPIIAALLVFYFYVAKNWISDQSTAFFSWLDSIGYWAFPMFVAVFQITAIPFMVSALSL